MSGDHDETAPTPTVAADSILTQVKDFLHKAKITDTRNERQRGYNMAIDQVHDLIHGLEGH